MWAVSTCKHHVSLQLAWSWEWNTLPLLKAAGVGEGELLSQGPTWRAASTCEEVLNQFSDFRVPENSMKIQGRMQIPRSVPPGIPIR